MHEWGGFGARILDFDIECRPLSWYGGDWVTKDVTVIAASWVNETPEVWSRVQTLDPGSQPAMLEEFVELYNQADIVTGHFIRGFDLPVMNGALTEWGMPTLRDKLTSDTKLDLVKRSGMSNSQESLGAMLGLDEPKIQMDQRKWRAANRLTPEGIALARERCVGDVVQHMAMRKIMLERGMLRQPVLWSGKASGQGSKYHG